MSAAQTLTGARQARAAGGVDRCLLLSAACVQEAQDEGDWATAFWAAAAPGVMHLGRAEPGLALGHFRRALQLALDCGPARLLGSAYHNLFVASRDAGNYESARRFRATAFELYRDTDARNPRLAALLADWSEGEFTRRPSKETAADALLHWRACPASLPDPKNRMLAACNQVVSAAWLGITPRYREGLSALRSALEDLPDTESVAVALSHAATGALKCEDYPEALRLAESALSIAVQRGEAVVEARAREVLNAALAERPAALHI